METSVPTVGRTSWLGALGAPGFSILAAVVVGLGLVTASVARAEDDELDLGSGPAGQAEEPTERAPARAGDVDDEDAELEALLEARGDASGGLPADTRTAARETASQDDDLMTFDEKRPGDAESVEAIPRAGGPVPQFEDPMDDGDSLEVLRFHRKLISERNRYRDPGENDAPLSFHLAGGPALVTEARIGAQLDFQFAFVRNFSLGLLANYASVTNQKSFFGQTVNGAITLLGGGAALNFYSRQPYEGIWIQVGSGYDTFRDATGSLGSQIPVFFSCGWRFLEDHHNLTFAFGLGGRAYLFHSEPRYFMTLKLEVGFGWNVFPH
jgi:hypothetical protein